MAQFRDSELAHRYLDDLYGIEIGGSAHNPFNLPHCLNVDYSGSMDTIFKQAEYEMCGKKLPVDIVADGSDLPIADESVDYVISSHMIEHIFDPIACIKEWLRVIKPGGYIFTIAPIKEYVPGEKRPITKLQELIYRHSGIIKPEDVPMGWNEITGEDGELSNAVTSGIINNEETGHFTVFDLALFVEMCNYIGGCKVIKKMSNDDKVGNGFCVLLLKNK